MPDFKPIYRTSWSDAMKLGEQEKWRESQAENIRCRDFLDKQVGQYYSNYSLDTENILRNSISEFGWDRTMHVLASHVQHYDYDGRFSSQNKDWAKGFYVPRPSDLEKQRDRYLRDHTTDFLLNSHNVLVDGLVGRVQKMYAGLNLYDHRHRVEGDVHEQEFTGKLLILRADVLKDEARTPENQLFLANVGGFGCHPHSRGRAVMGEFLIDGERANFNRQDFVGIADDRYLPDWAKEKLADLQSEQSQADAPDEDAGQMMKGM
jgi:hypothetical protein